MIRKSKISDLPAVIPLYRALISEMASLAPELYRPLSGNPGFILVETIEDEAKALLLAIDDGEVVGFATIGRAANAPQDGIVEETFGLLGNLYVLPEARGRGFGSALLDATFSWAKEQRLARVQLNVLATNEAANRLYQKNGFTPLIQTLSRRLNQN